jgi:hypothetical protein
MPLELFKTVEVIEVMENFIEKIRPDDEEILKEVDYGYEIEGQNIFIFCIRPKWNDREMIMHYPFAKCSYVKSKDEWKIYWLRGNMKWDVYLPNKKHKHFKELVELILEDKHHCFFG